MSQVLERQDGLVTALEKTLASLRSETYLPGQDVAWLRTMRQEALKRFAAADFRGSSVAPIIEEPFSMLPEPGTMSEAQARQALSVWLPTRAVFVDGFFSAELSALPQAKGVVIQSLAQTLETNPDSLQEPLRLLAEWGRGFARLSPALFQDGLYVRLQENASLPQPLQIAFLWSNAGNERAAARMSHPVVIVEAGKLSVAEIIEESAALGLAAPTLCWRNRSAMLNVAEGARMDYCQIQSGGQRLFETSATRVKQARESRFNGRTLTFGGELVRNDVELTLEGEGAECALSGLYATRGRDRVDNDTLIRHAAPRTVSQELYKGIMDGEARASFRGIIEVAPAAQKTDAKVYNKNLLLSDKGWVNTKPEFRIFANDVQCKHGSTVGRLSQEALFYLRSRGLGLAEARRFLIRAFAQEMLDPIRHEELRVALSRRLEEPAEAGGGD